MLFLQPGHRPISRPLGARRQDDHRPLLKKPVRGGKANASAAAGDQRYFILQPHSQDRLSKLFDGPSLAERSRRFRDKITLVRRSVNEL